MAPQTVALLRSSGVGGRTDAIRSATEAEEELLRVWMWAKFTVRCDGDGNGCDCEEMCWLFSPEFHHGID